SVHWHAIKSIFALEALLAFVGIASNSLLFLASYTSPAMKSKCNFLICICALFDVIHLAGNFIGVSVLIGEGYLNSLTCSIAQLLPELAVYAGCFCVLSIGVDRLVSVSWPIFYRQVDKNCYLTFHLIAIGLFTAYVPFLMITYYQPQ
ncbi:hypothetical protein PMAYCL1PPCAC_00715, partial [Pristionchus mayeri]